uniref:Uncharacterized protein n=1 Tax=Acrobeloides nanus TaxID=290746 RepID=A0A914EAQ5_9BILA
MYNDQQPDQETLPEWENIRAKRQSTIYAHAKGVSFFDRGSGRTFNYTQLPKIANQLYYIRPYIYSSGLPISMAAEISTLAKLISGEYKKGAPYSNVEEMITKGGTKFISIAKNAEFNADIYDGIVAPTLKTNLLTETWIKGYDITVNCSSIYPVVDVEYIKVGVSGQFRYTKDHSKLAISGDPTQPYICIGDINRMTSQYTRGGGTNCINNPEIWNTYFNMIQGTDPSDVCPVNN